MRIIAIANQKGGCGKTTVAINLAACLSREGQRTLLIDLDPQGHCALGLAVPEEQIENSMTDLLLDGDGKTGLDLPRITWQISNNFDLAPAKTDLSTLEERLTGVDGRHSRLRRVLERHGDRYDFVLIDSPPTIGFLTQTTLHAADEVIVPVDTGYFALHGLSKQLDSMRDVANRTGRPLKLRILGNLYDVRTKLAREILAELRKRHAAEMLSTFVNFNTKLKESTSFGQPITEYDPASIGCRDFIRLAREMISLGGAAPDPIADAIRQQADQLGADAARLLASPQALLGPHREMPTSIPAMPATPAASGETARSSPAHASMSGTVTTPVATATMTDTAQSAAMHDAEIQRKIERIYGPQPGNEGVVFTTRVPGANHVRLAGDFNGWNGEITPLRAVDTDGTFEVRMPLGPGRYRYRFVVDGRWVNDPFNPMVEHNQYGDLNNVVVVA